MVHCRRKSMVPGDEFCIVINTLPTFLAIDAEVTTIQPSYGKPFVPKQLLPEKLWGNIKIALQDGFLWNCRISRHFFSQVRFSFFIKKSSPCECRNKFIDG